MIKKGMIIAGMAVVMMGFGAWQMATTYQDQALQQHKADLKVVECQNKRVKASDISVTQNTLKTCQNNSSTRVGKPIVDKRVSYREQFPHAVSMDVYMQVVPEKRKVVRPKENVQMPDLNDIIGSEVQIAIHDESGNEKKDSFFDKIKRQKVSHGACKETACFSERGGAGRRRNAPAARATSQGGSPYAHSGSSHDTSQSGSKYGHTTRNGSTDRTYTPRSRPSGWDKEKDKNVASLDTGNKRSHYKQALLNAMKSKQQVKPADNKQEESVVQPDKIGLPSDDPVVVDEEEDKPSLFGSLKKVIKKVMGPVLGIVNPQALTKAISPIVDSVRNTIRSFTGSDTQPGASKKNATVPNTP